MPYGEKKKVTLYLYEEILEEALLKSGKKQSKLINELLIDYISINGSIEEREKKSKLTKTS